MNAKDLLLKRENAWDVLGSEKQDEIMKFCQQYKNFLDRGKTERECVQVSIELLEKKGFKPLDEMKTLKAGDKVYRSIRGKGLVAAIIGKEDMKAGLNILGAHIDSPRLDLKPMPMYEDSDMVFLKTHYYGGIKKYQWATIPLAIHGVIYNKDGEKIQLAIGENPEDPIFTINELLIHLSQEQMTRKAAEAIKGEELNLIIGSIPMPQDKKKQLADRVKLAVLQYLFDTYKICEKDFISAELELVPASHARDIGFDRSMVGAYGQDDRVCAFTSLMALLETKKPNRTSVCILSDKEEVGSGGNTGAQSRSYENALYLMMTKRHSDVTTLDFYTCIENSKMLSSDVSSAYDPSFASAYDKYNTCFAGKGVCLLKYSGSRGKSGANDANSEFFREVVNAYDANNVVWQTGELGRVDLGGGGTIAVDMANLGMQVIDCGVPVLSMHAPLEVTSKVDVYSAFSGYKVFLSL